MAGYGGIKMWRLPTKYKKVSAHKDGDGRKMSCVCAAASSGETGLG